MCAFHQTFVVQCREDYKTLNRCINDLEGLGRKARINTWFRPKDESSILGPPMTREEVCIGFSPLHKLMAILVGSPGIRRLCYRLRVVPGRIVVVFES